MPTAVLADSRHARRRAGAVPAPEFLGRARVARDTVNAWAERDSPAMLRIARDAQKAYTGRTTNVPLSLLESTERRWRALSREGCLHQAITLDGRDLTITDTRLVGATGEQLDPRYPGAREPAFCAISNKLILCKRRMFAQGPIIYGVTMNAVGFFFQLGFQPTWDGLMADMAMLARVAPTMVGPTKPLQFSIPSLSGDALWCGLRCQDPTTGNQFMDIRTVTSSDD